MPRNKVTVIGAGNVGATTAQRIAEAGLADVVLVDIVEGLPQGKGLDLAEAAPVVGHDAGVTGTNDYADTAGSDIVVVTSGLARQPGMSRDDLLTKNAGIVRSVVEQAAKASPDAILIVVKDRLDAMCHGDGGSGFPRELAIGILEIQLTDDERAAFQKVGGRGPGAGGRPRSLTLVRGGRPSRGRPIGAATFPISRRRRGSATAARAPRRAAASERPSAARATR